MDLIERHREQLEEICSKYNITLECILTLKRTPDLKYARIECFCFLRNMGYQYTGIAKSFGYRSHSTVLIAIKRHCSYKDKLKNVKI